MTKKKTTDCQNDHRSGCPITCTLELIGDKWSLLLIRDIVVGRKHRYGDFENSPEHIPTNILADRLKRLVNNDVLEKVSYQERPVRYAYLLTSKGADLVKVLQSIAKWGISHDIGQWEPPEHFWDLTPEIILNAQKDTIEEIMTLRQSKKRA